MNLDEASRILARLKAAFPTMTLDEEQAEVFLLQFKLLHDPSILEEAVGHLIQREERFPPIARIRLAYRSVAGARDAAERALERRVEPTAERGVPEWVNVWWWRSEQTMLARQAANTTCLGPVEQRPPVRMRQFPQFPQPLDPNAYSMEEYERIREAWVNAGSPRGSVDAIAAGTTTDVPGVVRREAGATAAVG